MSASKPTPPQSLDSDRLRPVRSRNSYRGSYGASPLVEASIARDLEDDDNNDRRLEESVESGSDQDPDAEDSFSQDYGERQYNSMIGSYRRPSYALAGPRAVIASSLQDSGRRPTRSERLEARREERSLLRDNNCIPPKHPQTGPASQSLLGRRISRLSQSLGVPGGDRKVVPPSEESESVSKQPADVSETAPLLGNPELPYGGQDSSENIDKQWTEAVAAGKIHTTWQREAKVLSRYAAPLIVTFLLQYSLTVASIFTVGHLGKVELAAVSLGSMTANITGYAIYQGLSTSLDTLCSQAYGSGNKKLVGLQTQRMV
ncbi:MAG: hypothetical protein Q9220_002824 [cf. Caloplaca sp. 1 TL-2023]